MYSQVSQSKWGDQAAAHLLNRAGFGGTPSDVSRLSRMRPAAAVDYLVDYDQTAGMSEEPTWVVPGAERRPSYRDMKMLGEEERREKRREYQKAQRQHLLEMRAWWLYRMRYTKRPLEEKLTLFWHGHFATGIRKVRSAYAMYKQNCVLREHACGNYANLVAAVAKDPAMLVYLDGARSQKKSPNENFARELMELFTLGEGHYTEEDIREAARAFTGWTIAPDVFEFEEKVRRHDRGYKRFMGKRGTFDGEDIIRIILNTRQAKEFIVRKLWSFFAYDDPEDRIVQDLADHLEQDGLELRPVLKRMFLSRAFYSGKAIRSQVKSPVQWLVGLLRSLEARMPNPRLSQYMMQSLGQELFEPPNVKGWDGGYTWITTAALFDRYNFAGSLVTGGFAAGGWKEPVVKAGRLLEDGIRNDGEAVLASLIRRVFQHPLREKDRVAFKEIKPAKGVRWSEDDIREALIVMMSTPQYQLT